MPILLSEITATDWSLKINQSESGEVVETLNDIHQCIRVILSTRKGSDPHRPLFGCDAWLYIDAPVNTAKPNIVREVADALAMWEPRITLISVTAAISLAQITVTITWKPKKQTIMQVTEVLFDNAA